MRIDVRLSNYDLAGSRMVLPMVSERDTVLHSWCVPAQWQAPTIVGGRGAHFWDADGHDYLDMSSLSECSNLGHQHPAVVKAICEQAERSCFVTSAWGAEPRAELAKVLLEKAGFERGRVFFYVGRCRCQRTRRQICAVDPRAEARVGYHSRSLISWDHLCLYGLVRRCAHESPN